MEKNTFNLIPEDIYANLPKELKDACELFEGHQKDIFLLSLLISYGATFNNVFTLYRGDTIYPNLYLAIYSRAGSGKSVMKWMRNIFDAINDYEIRESKKDLEQEEVEKYGFRTLFIPPNITSAQWAFQLAKNLNNQGIILCTEAETITKSASSKDMGGFADGLRICSEGEPFEVMRKTKKQHLIIKEPKLALLISGTPNQILDFIPTAEDGLASRFLYYSFEGVVYWNNYEKASEVDLKLELKPIKEHALNLYFLLTKHEKIEVVFSELQIDLLNQKFGTWTEFCKNHFGEESIPFVFRLAPRLLKIAMILSVLRVIPLQNIRLKKLKCQDRDFNDCLVIGELLLYKSMSFLEMLKKNQVHEKYYGKQFDLLMQLPETFQTSEFLTIANNLNVRQRTAEAWLARFADEKLVHKIKKGHYKKLFNNLINQEDEK